MKYALLYGFVILAIFLALFIGGANADNVASSKETINATLTKNAGAVSSNE
jgi:hypothetical protein